MVIDFITKDVINRIAGSKAEQYKAASSRFALTGFTALLVAFFICTASGNGFCQEATRVRIPVTMETINALRNSEMKLKVPYFLSRAFTLKISGGKNTTKPEMVDEATIDFGRQDSPEQIKQIEFTTGDKGELDNYYGSPPGREVFEIKFPSKENIRLRFARNTQKNRFELVSAMIETNNYTLYSEYPPYLQIQSTNPNNVPGKTEVQAIPIGYEQNYPSPNQPAAYRSTYIIGKRSLNKPGVVKYIQRENPAAPRQLIELLVDTYFDEAAFEGVNPDIAIAQMLHATNFLKNEQLMWTCNYAGFITTPGWKGYFDTKVLGVRAHIQHLKGYATDEPLRRKGKPEDPRFTILIELNYRGKAKTVEQLFGYWTASPVPYKKSIEDKLYWLYRYSDWYDSSISRS